MIPGSDENSQKRRHKIARYLNLTSALAWRELSIQLRAKYPSVHHLVDGGLMTENEFEALEEVQAVCPSVRWMTPLHWVQMILQEHIAEDQTGSSNYMKAIMGELMSFRQSFRALFCYDWVCVPLVYTQVATVATYSFFIFSLFGRQFTSAGDHLIFPIFLIVEFLFFVGWLKVGRELMRPFGHGDDDIELHWILDRNIAVSFAIVHNLQAAGLPKGDEENDIFWRKRGEKIEIPATGQNDNIKPRRPKLHTYLRREVSSQIRSKYPKMRDLVEGGLLTENELNALDDIRHSCPSVRWMAPLHWTQKICQETLDDGPDNTKFVGDFLSKLNTYRQSFRNLFCYDWVCVPLVYTQIAVLATYSYFFFSLFGRQFSDEGAELTFPLFLVIEFLFIVGWLKVAHELMRPFGHGDDDIELHWILDRNIAVSFAIVHKLQNTERPKGGDDDLFWKNRHLKIVVPKTGNNEKVKPERPKMHSYVKIPNDNSTADSGPEFDPSREREDHPHLYW
ncbi:unnamed protein product, partial [Mesorhabditis spiculigera]